MLTYQPCVIASVFRPSTTFRPKKSQVMDGRTKSGHHEAEIAGCPSIRYARQSEALRPPLSNLIGIGSRSRQNLIG
jgi:hypothetical protein